MAAPRKYSVELVEDFRTAHWANFDVYGARKIHVELNRAGATVAGRTVEW